jgi:hypothetical protein
MGLEFKIDSANGELAWRRTAYDRGKRESNCWRYHYAASSPISDTVVKVYPAPLSGGGNCPFRRLLALNDIVVREEEDS